MNYCLFSNQKSYPFILPLLPYNESEFSAYFSLESFEYHYGKHHKGYVDNLNLLLQNKESLHGMSLEELIIFSYDKADLKKIFNNAAQVWNHTFFWHSLNPLIAQQPTNRVFDIIKNNFGDFNTFISTFQDIAQNHFGSGWIWVICDEQYTLKIISTNNANTPIAQGLKPIIVCDLWEHAYYIDYRNKRSDYVSCFITKLVNWNVVEKRIFGG